MLMGRTPGRQAELAAGGKGADCCSLDCEPRERFRDSAQAGGLALPESTDQSHGNRTENEVCGRWAAVALNIGGVRTGGTEHTGSWEDGRVSGECAIARTG